MSGGSFYTIDIGCNFATNHYNVEKVKKIVNESYALGVDKVISISNALYEIPINESLSKEVEQLSFTAGVHPHNAKEITNLAQLDILKTYASNKKMVAIGEIGLDYNRMFSPQEKQIEVFEKQVDIAKELDLPIYLHCRDAFEDFINILQKKGHKKAVSHCFTGNKQEAQALVELGVYFGITGWLLDKRRNQDLIEAVKVIPIDRIFVETDAPFLSIQRKRDSLPFVLIQIIC